MQDNEQNQDWAITHGWRRYKLPRAVRCKFCNSRNVIKYGHYKDRQRWWCKACQRKFAGSSTIPRMRTPAQEVLAVLKEYYNKGMPLRSIRDEVNRKYNSNVSEATVHRWIDKYCRLCVRDLEINQPSVGDEWIVNEMVVRITGEEQYILDIMDIKTRFLLATVTCVKPETKDIYRLLQTAVEKAQKAPGQLLVLARYGNLDEIGTIEEVRVMGINVNIVEKDKCPALVKRYFPFSKRGKILSRIRKPENIQKIINGWTYHYNFRKEHKELSGKSPAEKAIHPRI